MKSVWAIGFVVGCLGCAQAPVAPAPESEFRNINPSWSPDGRRLAFETRRHGTTEIYLIDVVTGAEQRLTWSDGATENTHPSWAPDRESIVFDSDRGGVWNLYTIAPGDSAVQRLTAGGDSANPEHARHPEWSPDGRWIAFDSRRDGNGEIYVMAADGSRVRRLTETPGNESHAMWSPDGRVLFASTVDGERALWLAHPETGERTRLPSVPADLGGINMSPDGRRFVYLSTTEATPRLYIAPLTDPAAAIAITPEGRTSYEADWSPDGARVAFYSDATGVHEIYVVDADGRNARQLTGLQE